MKNGFILSLLLALGAAGGGYWFGQHHAPAKTSAPENSTSPDSSKLPGFLKLPPIKNPPPSAAENSAAPAAGKTKFTLAEIE
ncbi:MAG: hypothetical protein RL616_2101, partial [Verrucomicrobiota bacterium]